MESRKTALTDAEHKALSSVFAGRIGLMTSELVPVVERIVADRAAAWKAIVTEDLAVLERGGCQFWACKGPDVPPVAMETCHICWRIRDLRLLVKTETLDRNTDANS